MESPTKTPVGSPLLGWAANRMSIRAIAGGISARGGTVVVEDGRQRVSSTSTLRGEAYRSERSRQRGMQKTGRRLRNHSVRDANSVAIMAVPCFLREALAQGGQPHVVLPIALLASLAQKRAGSARSGYRLALRLLARCFAAFTCRRRKCSVRHRRAGRRR